MQLVTEGLSAGYDAVTVIHDVNLSLRKGSLTALLGPNGAGKSTTCKALVGLLPAAKGRILLETEDITLRPCWWRSRRGIFLAPEGRGIFPNLSVEDNLKFAIHDPSELAAVYERFAILYARRRLPAGGLSGGEQQMLALAPALVHDVKLLIVDEPTLGLAPGVADSVLALFAEMRASGGTILLVGESPRGIAEIADVVALIHTGHIVWSGPSSEFTMDRLERTYFGDQRISESGL